MLGAHGRRPLYTHHSRRRVYRRLPASWIRTVNLFQQTRQFCSSAVVTASHELLRRSADRPSSRDVRESEPEAFAFVVSQAIGRIVTDASRGYTHLYVGDGDELSRPLERIQRNCEPTFFECGPNLVEGIVKSFEHQSHSHHQHRRPLPVVAIEKLVSETHFDWVSNSAWEPIAIDT
jgi:hypothetical protein